MGWADNYIKKLQAGETVQFRPRGTSMSGRIESGQLVTVAPVTADTKVEYGDIVLCKVVGRQFLHLVKAKAEKYGVPMYKIGNNKGFTNGWTMKDTIYGIVTKVEP